MDSTPRVRPGGWGLTVATLKTKSPEEARRFCRSLVDRGFHQVPRTSDLRAPAFREFRVYRSRGWIRIAYQEPPVDGPLKPVPESAAPKAKAWELGGRKLACSKPCRCGCRRRAEVRGLSRACYVRWRYWNDESIREKRVNRSRNARALQRAQA